MDEPKFDAKREFDLSLPSAEGTKKVRVRFPTDEEWKARQRKRKTIIKHLGRGQSETVASGGEAADEALLTEIRLDDGGPLDAYEAERIIQTLSRADVEDVTRDGSGFSVAMRVLGARVTHTAKMPSQRQIAEYRRTFFRAVDLPYGKQEIRVNLEAGAALYDAIAESTEGYASAVPAIHKSAAAQAVAQAVDSELEGGEENF